MNATAYDTYRFSGACGDADSLESFERFRYRRETEFPVRSQAARTRGKKRSRGGVAARHKSAAYNGANRRGRGKHWA